MIGDSPKRFEGLEGLEGPTLDGKPIGVTAEVFRCKVRKPDSTPVDGCGWQGQLPWMPSGRQACPKCGSPVLRLVSPLPPFTVEGVIGVVTTDPRLQYALNNPPGPRHATLAGETRVTDPKTGGQKGVKLERFDLVPWEPLTALARLYGKGAIKYEPDNWRRGYAWRLSLGGMLRHVALWAVGKSWDTADGTKDGPIEHDEAGKPIHTGEHHLTCAAWHCFTLYVFETQNLGTDDRAKTA